VPGSSPSLLRARQLDMERGLAFAPPQDHRAWLDDQAALMRERATAREFARAIEADEPERLVASIDSLDYYGSWRAARRPHTCLAPGLLALLMSRGTIQRLNRADGEEATWRMAAN